MTLVISGLYLGNIYDAKDENWLKRHGVTHIINAAEEVPNFYTGIFKYTNLNMKDNRRRMQLILERHSLGNGFICDSFLQ